MKNPTVRSPISPTAHYTGYTWVRHGMSDPTLSTATGRLMVAALQPVWKVATFLGLPTIDGVLLTRHQLIDHLLTEQIEAGRVSQVIEVAAGLSPRGLRFSRAYGTELTYIEADLPDMARHKQSLLAKAGLGSPNHKVVTLDVLSTEGPTSLTALAEQLDPSRGLAIVTEGLINYFDTGSVLAMWSRFAVTLQKFSSGVYLSDLHVKDANSSQLVQLSLSLLSTFVRGRVHLHFDDKADALDALDEAGFDDARVHNPATHSAVRMARDDPGARLVRVIEATTGA